MDFLRSYECQSERIMYMENTFKQGKYTFVELKAKKGYRPYRVRCLETGEEKDSSISYADAAGLLLDTYSFADELLKSDSQNQNYIEKIFSQLLGKKKSECTSIVKDEIALSGKIQGCITQISSAEKLEPLLEYQTKHFDISVLFENGLTRGATKIIVKKGGVE